MTFTALAIPVLLGTAILAPAAAQTLPQLPTHAQAVAADTRQGSSFTAYGLRSF